MENSKVRLCSAKELIGSLEAGSVNLIATDPPYGTGKYHQISTPTDKHKPKYKDNNPAVMFKEITEMLNLAHDKLADDGMVAVILNNILAHRLYIWFEDHPFYYVQSEILWHTELGNVSKKWWPNKHHYVIWASKSPKPKFDIDGVPEVVRKAPKEGYLGAKKATSVLTYTLSSTDPERAGYPNQKPLYLMDAIVRSSTAEGDLVVDPYVGSGATVVAAAMSGRDYLASDTNSDAVEITKKRLEF